MEEKCENCKYYKRFIPFDGNNYNYNYSTSRYCCIMLCAVDPEDDSFVIETTSRDRCEVFTEKN